MHCFVVLSNDMKFLLMSVKKFNDVMKCNNAWCSISRVCDGKRVRNNSVEFCDSGKNFLVSVKMHMVKMHMVNCN